MSITDILFNQCDDPEQLQIDEQTAYVSTPWREGNFISKTIINYMDSIGISNFTITDATAHVGCNTINFYLNHIQNVNSVEIDEHICHKLINNLHIYQLPTNRVYCGDYAQLLTQLKQDVVFIDAPWGGRHVYQNHPHIDLFLGNVDLVDICDQLWLNSQTQLIVLKVPTNFNYLKLQQHFTPIRIMIQTIYRGAHHSYDVLYIPLGTRHNT
jgi:hypothetical protein